MHERIEVDFLAGARQSKGTGKSTTSLSHINLRKFRVLLFYPHEKTMRILDILDRSQCKHFRISAIVKNEVWCRVCRNDHIGHPVQRKQQAEGNIATFINAFKSISSFDTPLPHIPQDDDENLADDYRTIHRTNPFTKSRTSHAILPTSAEPTSCYMSCHLHEHHDQSSSSTVNQHQPCLGFRRLSVCLVAGARYFRAQTSHRINHRKSRLSESGSSSPCQIQIHSLDALIQRRRQGNTHELRITSMLPLL